MCLIISENINERIGREKKAQHSAGLELTTSSIRGIRSTDAQYGGRLS